MITYLIIAAVVVAGGVWAYYHQAQATKVEQTVETDVKTVVKDVETDVTNIAKKL